MIVIDTDYTVRAPGPNGSTGALVRVFVRCDRCRRQLGDTRYEDTDFDRGYAYASALSAGGTEYLDGRVRRIACPACAQPTTTPTARAGQQDLFAREET